MMKRARLIAIMFVSLPLLSACEGPTVTSSACIIDTQNLYYEELKGWVAALEYSTEYAPSETSNIVQGLQVALAQVYDEGIDSNYEKVVRMTHLTDEFAQLYEDNASDDETGPKIAELVAIAKSLPGKEIAYDTYYEFPESDGEQAPRRTPRFGGGQTMSRTIAFTIALVLLLLLVVRARRSLALRQTPQDLYHEMLKGRVAALAYSTEHARSESLRITQDLLAELASSDFEGINGHEDEIARLADLANELEKLYVESARVDKTNQKVAELVAIVESLPGKEQDYRLWWEYPETDEE